MDLQDYDTVGLRLVAIGSECAAADNELRELKAKQAAAAREVVVLEGKYDRVVEERRSINQRQKVAMGLAFYELLKENGLVEVLARHAIQPAEYVAAVRRVLSEVSPTTKKPLAANVVDAMAKCLSASQKWAG